MIIEIAPKPFEMLIIKDTFSENELNSIWYELNHLHNVNAFLDPEKTGSARDNDGNLKKQNKAIFLDTVYKQRNFSSILPLLEEKVLSIEVKEKMLNINPAFGNFASVNSHVTLISYYEESDYYKAHSDLSVFSTLTYIFKEPKNFIGGDIYFYINDKEFKIAIENNLSIVFPSAYLHEVSPITMIDRTIPLSGRHCLSIFTGLILGGA